MRKQGLIGLLITAGIVLLLMYFLTDTWMEARLESAGTSLMGAKVELDDFDLSLVGLHVKWNRLQVTDPQSTMKNIIETGTCEFDMEFWPLLSGKYIIENIQATGIRTNTDRETDGWIETAHGDVQPGYLYKTMDRLRQEVDAMPPLNISGLSRKLNVDSVFALLELQTPARYDTLKNEVSDRYTFWNNKFNTLNFQNDLNGLGTKIKSIDVTNINDLTKIQNALKEIEEVKSSAESLTKEIKQTKTDLNSDLAETRKSIQSVDDWISEDYQRAMSKAKLPDIDAKNIGKMIFGKRIVDQVNKYLGYVSTARSYSEKFKSKVPKEERPPRLKGQDIYFYSENARPDWWIKQMTISGMTGNNISLEGNVNNIVSDQTMIGSMTDMRFEGKGTGHTRVTFTGVLNYLEEIPSEMFDLTYADFPLTDVKLSESRFLPNRLEKGSGTLQSQFEMRGEKIDGKINFTGNALKFEKSADDKAGNKAEQIIQDVVQATNNVTFSAKIFGEQENLKFGLSSNLDELFAQNLKAVIGREVEQAKEKIRERVDKEVATYKQQAENLIRTHEEKLTGQIIKYETELEEKKQLIEKMKQELEAEKKKLQDKIDQEKKKAEEEARKKIKGLFKP